MKVLRFSAAKMSRTRRSVLQASFHDVSKCPSSRLSETITVTRRTSCVLYFLKGCLRSLVESNWLDGIYLGPLSGNIFVLKTEFF